MQVDNRISVISASQVLNETLLPTLGNYVAKLIGCDHKYQREERITLSKTPLTGNLSLLNAIYLVTFVDCNQNLIQEIQVRLQSKTIRSLQCSPILPCHGPFQNPNSV